MDGQEVARILVYGDLHLSSKNYGAHFDYPKDSLEALRLVTKEAMRYQPTHIIGLGDLTYGRFNKLEYRTAVEEEFIKQAEICEGRHYELKGNHDTASYGMTEYEYYIGKRLIKQPDGPLTLGDVKITFVNSGECHSVPFEYNRDLVNIIMMHDFFKFTDTRIANFGDARILDNFEQWFGVDIILGGHIHESNVFEGIMSKDGEAKNVLVDYVGSMSRPSYIEGMTNDIGHMVEITVYDGGKYKYERLDIKLPSIAETFNIASKEKKASKNLIDISDIVEGLDKHERRVGNPEDIINALDGVPEKYKLKAIELLKVGMG